MEWMHLENTLYVIGVRRTNNDGLLLGTMDMAEAKEWIKDIVVTNERGDAKEYVMHGSNISGIVTGRGSSTTTYTVTARLNLTYGSEDTVFNINVDNIVT